MGNPDVMVTAYGKTPGDRKTLAIAKATEVWASVAGPDAKVHNGRLNVVVYPT